MKAALAEALALRGEPVMALQVSDESIAQIERPGWGERARVAENLRVQGVILEQLGRADEAELNLQRALTVARDQQAKSWELRSVVTLARLWRSQGKDQEAHALVTPIHDWFTEGFDTRDLKEAGPCSRSSRRSGVRRTEATSRGSDRHGDSRQKSMRFA